MALILLKAFEEVNHTEYIVDRQVSCAIRSEDIISMRETYKSYTYEDKGIYSTVKSPLTYIRIKSTESATGVYSTYVSEYIVDILNIIEEKER